MDDKDDMPMRVATFRFGTIADFVTGAKLAYGEKERLLAEKACRTYEIPGTVKTRVSRATLLSWVTLYRKGAYKIESLKPKPRADRGSYPSLSTTLRMAIRGLKDENEYYTVPVIIKKLRLAKLVGPDESMNKATIYRFIRHEDLKKPSKNAEDRRRYETEHSNDVWQCDVLHGPMVEVAGQVALKKAYLMAIIDDHSRLIVYAAFYLSETFETLKDALHQAVARRGLPQKFYVDNGACYRSDQLERVLSCLGIQLTHSPPYRPQGRGKIERWFKNVRDSFLPMLPAVEPLSLTALNDRLEGFVDDYNNSEHGVTKQTPYSRYRDDLSCVRAAPEHLLSYFRRREYRRVKKDRSVQVKGRVFEVSAQLIDKTVELLFHADTPDDVEVKYQELSYGRAVPLNLAVNAKGGRDYGATPPRPPQPKEPTIFDLEPAHGGRLFDHAVYSAGEEES